jgi:hypothetical protein
MSTSTRQHHHQKRFPAAPSTSIQTLSTICSHKQRKFRPDVMSMVDDAIGRKSKIASSLQPLCAFSLRIDFSHFRVPAWTHDPDDLSSRPLSEPAKTPTHLFYRDTVSWHPPTPRPARRGHERSLSAIFQAAHISELLSKGALHG